MYWRIQDLWGPANLVDRRLPSWMIPYHTSRMYIGIVCGPPTDARRGMVWKTCIRVR
jgi:hypothetical protein